MANNPNVGESGRPFYFYVGFDMSGNTRLEVEWTKPDGTTMNRDSSGDGVVVGTSAVFLTALSATVTANEYLIYTLGTRSAPFANSAEDPGEIDQAGDWAVRAIYIVSTDTPVTRLISDRDDANGNVVVMTVEP